MTTLPTNYGNGNPVYASDINAITTQVNTLTLTVGSGGIVVGPSGNLTLTGSYPGTVDFASSVNLTGTLAVGSATTLKGVATVWDAVTIGQSSGNQLVVTPGASPSAGITIAASGSGLINITGATIEANGSVVITAAGLQAAIIALMQGLPTAASSGGPTLWNDGGLLSYT